MSLEGCKDSLYLKSSAYHLVDINASQGGVKVENLPDGEHIVSIWPLEHSSSAVTLTAETAMLSSVRKDQVGSASRAKCD